MLGPFVSSCREGAGSHRMSPKGCQAQAFNPLFPLGIWIFLFLVLSFGIAPNASYISSLSKE